MKRFGSAILVFTLVLIVSLNGASFVHAEDPQPTISVANAKTVKALATLEADAGEIGSLAFNADGSMIATGHQNSTIHLWNAKTQEESTVLKGDADEKIVNYLHFMPDDTLFAMNTQTLLSKILRFWDVKKEKSKVFGAETFGLAIGTSAVAISEDGSMIAHDVCQDINFNENGASCVLSGISIQDAKSEEELAALKPTIKGIIWALAFSPDGKLLAATGGDGGVRLIDTSSGKVTKTLAKLPKPTLGIAFSPDGSLIAVAVADGNIKLWNIKTGAASGSLKVGSLAVVTVAFSPDGTVLAAAGVDKSIHLWDVKAKKKIISLKNHKDIVMALSFNPDGTILASGSLDGTVVLWAAK